MDCKNIIINNQSIALYQKGSGETTLFLIHGNSCSSELFSRQFDSSLAEKFHLVAIDLPGHGNSAHADNAEDAYSFSGFGGIISGVADYLQLENVVYIGHSLGGHIILQSWDKFRSVKGLVIFGSTPVGDPSLLGSAFLPHPALKDSYSADLSEEMIQIRAESLFKPSGKIPDFVFDDIRKSDPLARKVIGESIPKGLLRDELKLAEKLNVPLAIFHGEDDQLVNPEYLEQLSITMTWKNKIHYITDAGHSPQWENSDRFNALLEEYAAEVLNC